METMGCMNVLSENIKVPVTTKTPQKYQDNNKINSYDESQLIS